MKQWLSRFIKLSLWVFPSHRLYRESCGRFYWPTAILIHSLAVSFSWFTKYALVNNWPDSIYECVTGRSLSQVWVCFWPASGKGRVLRCLIDSSGLVCLRLWFRRLLCFLRASAWLCCGVMMRQTLVSSRLSGCSRGRRRRRGGWRSPPPGTSSTGCTRPTTRCSAVSWVCRLNGKAS